MKHHRFIPFVIFCILMSTLPGAARNTQSVLNEFQANEGTNWTFHFNEDGKVRAMYGAGAPGRIFNENDAKSFFADYAEMFGIEDLSQLRFTEFEKETDGSSFIFRQYYFGLPVVGGELAVHTDSQASILSVRARYHSMKGLPAFSKSRKGEARATALRSRFAAENISNGTLMILPALSGPRPVWVFETTPNAYSGQWAIYVDALKPNKVLRVQRQFFEEEQATGTVFPENPVVTPAFSSERFFHMKDSTTLNGTFTKIYNANFQLPFPRNGDVSAYTTASESDDDYTYPISDPRFTEAMAYFHINVVHDRWRSFGFKKLNRQIPVFVNIATGAGEGFDNAFYTRGTFNGFRNGAIVMGAGNNLENLGHDADVYYHEYGHAVLDHAKPRFFESFESNYPFAFHEGFSDISASAITGNAKLAEFGLRSKRTGRFLGRDLENRNRFPQDVILKGFGKSESHHTGLIIGGAWWDLQKQIGIDKAQSILYASLAILPNDMNFFDLRNSMLTADLRKNGSANSAAIESAFARHGIEGEDPGQKGTIQFRSLKTARLNLSNFSLTLRSTFKRGDYIVVLAEYSGSGLTPGYNLISDLEITGPPTINVDAFPFIDEAVNGVHLRKQGAWVAEIGTFEFSDVGQYTVAIRFRLGGTSTVSETRTVKFKLT